MSHWPWWAGASAFTLISVGYLVLLRRPLGISGALATVLHRDVVTPPPSSDDGALEAMMLAMTRAQFGDDAMAAAAQAPPSAVTALPPRLGPQASGAFLAALVVGGFLGQGLTGGTAAGLPEILTRTFGDGPIALVALFVGGVAVGVGTQMAGGCTTGNGLVGCARLQPASLGATAAFFGMGIVTSWVMAWVAS